MTLLRLAWQFRRVRRRSTDAAKAIDAANLADSPFTRLRKHFDQLGHDLVINVIEFFELFLADVTAFICEFQPHACFLSFAFGVAQLAYEMCFITPLAPRLCQIRTNRT